MDDGLSIKKLFSSGVHFGHLARFQNSKMAPYIFGVVNKISIVDLDKTLICLKRVEKFVKKISSNNGTILFVGTKKNAQNIIKEYAIKCNMPYVDHRWLGGMLTNYKTIKQSIRRLNYLEKIYKDGTLNHLTKKEGLSVIRELNKLKLILEGIKNMTGLPDVIFIVDVNCEEIAVKEANKLNIPIIGVVDSNSNPNNIDYVIPGNDDAIRSIKLYVEIICNSIINNKN